MSTAAAPAAILTPDQRLRVFVSSTLEELAPERAAAHRAIDALHLVPVMFELGARPHPPRSLYRAYLEQSHVFVAIYWERYGWVAPEMDVSGLEDELLLALDLHLPKLVYLKRPATREPGLERLLERVRDAGDVSYKAFETPEALERMLADDLALLLTERFHRVSDDSAATTVERRATGLSVTPPPVPMTALVGRDREADEVAELLRRDDVRLVSLTGTGGIGKTRLAIEAARRVAGDFADGLAYLGLAAIPDPETVLTAIAATVGVRDLGSLSVLAGLTAHLRDRALLLVLDNFEHLLPAAGDVIALLDGAPGLKLLVTSRSALRVRAEHEYRVPPLAVPAPDARGDALVANEAVRLFAQRADAVRRDFIVDASNRDAIAAVCRRLDGLPLAIELAAARVRVLPPAELLARLERRLDLPSGPRDLPERQRTLRSTIDWSFDLLAEPEQRLLARLGVFHGTFGLDAVESIGDPDGTLDVLDVLGSLVDKSLVQTGDWREGEARFSLLHVVREYALERLAAAGDTGTASRHAHYYADLSVGAYDALRGPHQRGALERLDHETGNILAAFTWLLGEGEVERLAEIAWALWIYCWGRGLLAESRRLGSAALALPGPISPLARAKLLASGGVIAMWQGDFETAIPELTEAHELAREAGDDALLANTRLGLSFMIAVLQGPEAAAREMRDVRDAARALGDAWLEASALTTLAWLECAQEESDVGQQRAEEALLAQERIGDEAGIALARTCIAEELARAGRLDEAAVMFARVVRAYRELRLVYMGASALDGVAALLTDSGSMVAAARLLGAADAAVARIGAARWGPSGERRERLEARLTALLGTDRATLAGEGADWDLDRALTEAEAALARSQPDVD